MKQYKFTINNQSFDIKVLSVNKTEATVNVNGKDLSVSIDEIKRILPENIKTETTTTFRPTPSKVAPKVVANTISTGDGTPINAPIPGQIKGIYVQEGDKVAEGQKLLVMEAMKMENVISSQVSGIVSKIYIGDGDNVTQDQQLILIGSV